MRVGRCFQEDVRAGIDIRGNTGRVAGLAHRFDSRGLIGNGVKAVSADDLIFEVEANNSAIQCLCRIVGDASRIDGIGAFKVQRDGQINGVDDALWSPVPFLALRRDLVGTEDPDQDPTGIGEGGQVNLSWHSS